MKHTPGPWRVCGLNIASESEVVVASAYKDSPDSVVQRPKDDVECLANARLIAAVPEMYDALEQAEMDYGDMIGYARQNREPATNIEILWRRREAIRAIIAKIAGN